MKLFQILCIVLLQQAYAQQQSMETCSALDTMIANRDDGVIGSCSRDTLCTQIMCSRSISLFITSLTIRVTMTILPCDRPIRIREVVHVSGAGNILDVTTAQTESRSVPEIGELRFMLTQIPTGINYGVLLVSGGQTAPVLPTTDIPLQCPSLTTTTAASQATASQVPTTQDPLQQSMETCTALDMMITNRNVGGIGTCTRNTLCTMVTCMNGITDPIATTITNIMTIHPCESPVQVSATASAPIPFLGTRTFVDVTITESRNVTPSEPASSLGDINFMLTQTATGINFGVSTTRDNQRTVLLPTTDIPLQCGSQRTTTQSTTPPTTQSTTTAPHSTTTPAPTTQSTTNTALTTQSTTNTAPTTQSTTNTTSQSTTTPAPTIQRTTTTTAPTTQIPTITTSQGPLQQSMETCTALDMMITNRDVENIGMCTRNTLCTMITCRRTVTIPISIIVTNEMTILPCETPVAVRAVTTALLSGSSPMTFINETITESRDVTPPGIAAALGTISFMLTQTDTGINFGVSLVNDQRTVLLPNTDIPLQCGPSTTQDPLRQQGTTNSALRMEALIKSVSAATLLGTLYVLILQA